MNIPARFALIVANLVMVGYTGARAVEPPKTAGLDREDIPKWFKECRAFYCPFTDSGSGSSLMKFNSGGSLEDRIESFRDLPKMLDEAERLGTNVLYVNDYWQPKHEAKGEYIPKESHGGMAGLADGVAAVHKRGGRVILYFEPFIISRKTEFAERVGPKWAMMNKKGEYYSYYDTGARFYLMWPGQGSGWADHVVSVIERYAKACKIDGVHLDSYGVHLVYKDYNPAHPDGQDPDGFNKAALALIKRVRATLRKYNPEAIVILEGAEHEDFLDACDGAQIESLEVLKKKKWFRERRFPIFTSSFELLEMKAILDEGYQLALSSWWQKDTIGGRDEKRLAEETDKRNRFDQIISLNRYNNLLVANDVRGHLPLGESERIMQSIIHDLNRRKWHGSFVNRSLVAAVKRVQSLYAKHKDELTRTPADCLRDWVHAAQKVTAGQLAKRGEK